MIRCPNRTIVLTWLLLFGAYGADARGQEAGRTHVVRLDKFGNAPPDQPLEETVGQLKSGDRMQIEFWPARLFDFRGVDFPQRSAVEAVYGSVENEIFAYPADAYLLFGDPSGPVSDLPLSRLHPGASSLYVWGLGRYKLKLSYFSLDELRTNHTSYQELVDALVPAKARCFAWGDPALVGRSELDKQAQGTIDLEARGWGETPANRLYRFDDITIEQQTDKPFLLLELVRYEGGLPEAECTPQSWAAVAADQRHTLGSVVVVALARVAPEFTSVRLQERVDLRTRWRTFELTDEPYAVYAVQFDSLRAGTSELRVCYRPTEESAIRVRAPALEEWCVPNDFVHIAVKDASLPSSVRFQPGLIAVNKFREPRVTAHLVLITDRDSYFGRTSRKVFGGIINPMVGIQLTGSDTRLIGLFGVQVRVIDEGGFVVGIRFGADDLPDPWRFEENWFVGFSLDPLLFGRLKGS